MVQLLGLLQEQQNVPVDAKYGTHYPYSLDVFGCAAVWVTPSALA